MIFSLKNIYVIKDGKRQYLKKKKKNLKSIDKSDVRETKFVINFFFFLNAFEVVSYDCHNITLHDPLSILFLGK